MHPPKNRRPILAACALALAITFGHPPAARAATLGQDLGQLTFEQVITTDDLSSLAISCIVQDTRGFIWIGSRSGLHRFDGYRLESYFADPNDPSALTDSYVETVHASQDGTLWVGTIQGLSHYDPATERFKSYLVGRHWTHVTGIAESPDGSIHVAIGSDLLRLSPGSDEFETVLSKTYGEIRSLLVDRDGALWFGSSKGITLLDSSGNPVATFPIPGSEAESGEVVVTAIAESPLEAIWFGTDKRGAFKLDRLTAAVTAAPLQDLQEEKVGAIAIDQAGRVLIGSTAGLRAIDGADGGATTLYQNNEFDRRSLQTGTVYGLLVDRQGNLWTGTSRGGLRAAIHKKAFRTIERQPGLKDGLTKDKATSVFESRQGALWVGYHNDGIDRLDRANGQKLHIDPFEDRPGNLGRGAVWQIAEDRSGALWIATHWTGLQRLDPGDSTAEHIQHRPDDPRSISGNDARRIAFDQEDNLWVAIDGKGVDHYDREADRFTHYRFRNGTWFEASGDEPSGRVYIYDLLVDSRGDLWIGGTNGLYKRDRATGAFSAHRYPAQSAVGLPPVSALIESRDGSIWIGTDNGLFRYQNSAFEEYNDADGLPNNAIRSLIEDDESRIWIGTAKGLASLDPANRSINAYDKADGLSSNEFVARAVSKLRSGEFVFGTETGLTLFRPEEIRSNQYPPDVYIIGFKLFNQPVSITPDGEGPLRQSITETSHIVLPPGSSTISFEWAALNYISPDKNRYRYRLEGFDKQWVEIGTQREGFYTNLDPGDFTFRVMASNNDGVWNERGAAIAITILPYFWQTTGFLVLCALSAIALSVSTYQFRMSIVRKQKALLQKTVDERTSELRSAMADLELQKERVTSQNLELEEHRKNLETKVHERTRELEKAKEKAEESDRLKSSFLANMSHEIRTPMNAIMGFVGILAEKEITQEKRVLYSEIVHRNGESLLALIDDILDLSRLEAGEVKIDRGPCHIGQVLNDLYLHFNAVIESKKPKRIRLLKLVPPGSEGLRLALDPIRLRQIISNLLENAVKFTEQGEIRFGFDLVGDGTPDAAIVFYVRDTGIGIAAENLQRVFDRFHKVEDAQTKLYRGTGLGLSIVSKLSSLMSGKISVESTHGKGACFQVAFPLVRLAGDRLPSRAADARRLDQLPSIGTLTILVAEDEDPNFQYIKVALEETGCQIERAADGEQAVTLAQSLRPDLILMDLQMPILDGIAAIRRIRASGLAVPIIAQTAYSQGDEQERCFEAGADRYLQKPYTKRQLVDSIVGALDLPV